MSDGSKDRLQIVAAMVTIFMAFWYFLRPKTDAVVPEGVYAPPSGDVYQYGQPGQTAASGAPGQIGEQGEPGQPGQPGAPGEPGIPGTQGVQGTAGMDAPQMAISVPYSDPQFAAVFDVPEDGINFLPSFLTGNLPADWNTPTYYMGSLPLGGDDCGCGCGGAEKSKGSGGCANRPTGATFVDGPGLCFSSTPGTLEKSITDCVPNAFTNMQRNMMSNTQYMGTDGAGSVPDWLSSVFSNAMESGELSGYLN